MRTCMHPIEYVYQKPPVGTIQLFELWCNMFMLDSNLAHFNVPSIHITFFVFYYLICTSKLLCSR